MEKNEAKRYKAQLVLNRIMAMLREEFGLESKQSFEVDKFGCCAEIDVRQPQNTKSTSVGILRIDFVHGSNLMGIHGPRYSYYCNISGDDEDFVKRIRLIGKDLLAWFQEEDDS